MLRKLLITAITVAVLVGAIVYAKLEQFSAMGKAAESMVLPPETVTAMTVDESLWEQSLAAVGTLVPVQGVTVSAEVGGRVTRIGFDSGAAVEAGDVLLQMDTASEEAQLASAEASAALAEADLKRLRALDARELASKDAVDAAEARAKETRAQVGNMRALIAKKTVRAPFSGRLGLRLVNLGEVLRAGMFARVEVVLPDQQSVLPIPATAVLYAPYGDSVFVIETRPDDQSGTTSQVLRQQFVRLGRARGDFVDVTDGLSPGETVVTTGVFKLSSDMQVVIDNRLAPAASLAPQPSDS